MTSTTAGRAQQLRNNVHDTSARQPQLSRSRSPRHIHYLVRSFVGSLQRPLP